MTWRNETHRKSPRDTRGITEEDLSYAEYPIKILETSERVTQNQRTRMCKVQWGHHSEDEATWEREENLKAEFPYRFGITSKDEVQGIKTVRCSL